MKKGINLFCLFCLVFLMKNTANASSLECLQSYTLSHATDDGMQAMYKAFYASERLANKENIINVKSEIDLTKLELSLEKIDSYAQESIDEFNQKCYTPAAKKTFITEFSRHEYGSGDNDAEFYQKYALGNALEETLVNGFISPLEVWQRITKNVSAAKSHIPALRKEVIEYEQAKERKNTEKESRLIALEEKLKNQEAKLAEREETARKERLLRRKQQEIALREQALQKPKSSPSQTHKTKYSEADVTKLNYYGLLLGRAAGCGFDVGGQSARVGKWVDHTFEQDNTYYLSILAKGMELNAKAQMNGTSPDSCSSIKSQVAKAKWP